MSAIRYRVNREGDVKNTEYIWKNRVVRQYRDPLPTVFPQPFYRNTIIAPPAQPQEETLSRHTRGTQTDDYEPDGNPYTIPIPIPIGGMPPPITPPIPPPIPPIRDPRPPPVIPVIEDEEEDEPPLPKQEEEVSENNRYNPRETGRIGLRDDEIAGRIAAEQAEAENWDMGNYQQRIDYTPMPQREPPRLEPPKMYPDAWDEPEMDQEFPGMHDDLQGFMDFTNQTRMGASAEEAQRYVEERYTNRNGPRFGSVRPDSRMSDWTESSGAEAPETRVGTGGQTQPQNNIDYRDPSRRNSGAIDVGTNPMNFGQPPAAPQFGGGPVAQRSSERIATADSLLTRAQSILRDVNFETLTGMSPTDLAAAYTPAVARVLANLISARMGIGSSSSFLGKGKGRE